MKHYRLSEAPFSPVSHNPEVKKQVLSPEGPACLRNVSHVVFQPGNTAAGHAHEDACEVFFCIRGEMIFNINGREETLRGGELLVVEPGDFHSVTNTVTETELFYFFALKR